MCTFWFFIKQSSSLIMAQTIKHFVRFLKYLTYGSLLAYSIYVVQWIVVKAAQFTTNELFCHNFEFIFGESIQMILTSVFLGFSYLLAKEINKQNAVLVERVQTTGEELTRSDRQTLKARVDSLKSLKIIVWTFWLSTAFNLLYSVITRIMQGDNCFIVTRAQNLTALVKLADRLDAFVIWMWPLIYLFWPTRRHEKQQKRIDRISDAINSTESHSIFQSSEAHNSINRYAPIEYPVQGNYRVNPTELSSSSSDDNEYDFRGYHNAQPFKITREAQHRTKSDASNTSMLNTSEVRDIQNRSGRTTVDITKKSGTSGGMSSPQAEYRASGGYESRKILSEDLSETH